jgi:thiamine biosynthesis lipoprotein
MTARRLRIALGTLIAIEASSHSPASALAAIESAFAAIVDVDRRMHPRSAHAQLARINAAPLGEPVTVHPSIGELLQLAQRLGSLTDGVFDPCLPHRPGRLRDVEVDCDGRIVCHAPVALDFGGFAKGYAVDRAIEALAAHGCAAGLVNAGGDLRVFGSRTEPILLRGRNGELTPVALSDGALAVSDADSRRRPPEHQGYYNRVSAADRANSAGDSKTAASFEADASVSRDAMITRFAAVIAPEACIADALVKCVLLCSKNTAERVLRDFGATRISSD